MIMGKQQCHAWDNIPSDVTGLARIKKQKKKPYKPSLSGWVQDRRGQQRHTAESYLELSKQQSILYFIHSYEKEAEFSTSHVNT